MPKVCPTRSERLRKADGRLDWSRPARVLDRKIRAFTPWPGTFTFWQGRQDFIGR